MSANGNKSDSHIKTFGELEELLKNRNQYLYQFRGKDQKRYIGYFYKMPSPIGYIKRKSIILPIELSDSYNEFIDYILNINVLDISRKEYLFKDMKCYNIFERRKKDCLDQTKEIMKDLGFKDNEENINFNSSKLNLDLEEDNKMEEIKSTKFDIDKIKMNEHSKEFIKKVHDMYTKDIAKQIRKDLKETFGNIFKFSVTVGSGGSYTSSIEISIMRGPIDFYSKKYIECLKTQNWEEYREKNSMHIDGYTKYSEEGEKVLDLVEKIRNRYNHNRSNPMTDYFDYNYYGSVEVGKWDKPYNGVKYGK